MKKLNELTVWAIYAMRFANTKRRYIDSWQSVISNRAESVSEIISAATEALRIYTPDWNNIKPKGSHKYQLYNDLRAAKEKLAEAEEDYINAACAGGRLTMELREERVKKLKAQINKIGNQIERDS